MEYQHKDQNQIFFTIKTKIKIYNMCKDQKLVLTSYEHFFTILIIKITFHIKNDGINN